MKLTRADNNRGIVSTRVAACLMLCAFAPFLIFAGAPDWWSSRGVRNPTAGADDFALVNQGQLKNIATAAAAEMDAKLSGGAGSAVHNLLGQWAPATTQTSDFAPLNIGQLKTVAKPFYDQLAAAGLANGYPWNSSSGLVDDFALANIGQVKNLFGFSVPAANPSPITLAVTVLSPTKISLSWTLGSPLSTTTIYVSIDGGKTWFDLGVTAAGVSTATISNLPAGANLKFAVSSGGDVTNGGLNDFGWQEDATNITTVPPEAVQSDEVVTAGQPVLEGEETEYTLAAWGYKAFTGAFKFYSTQTVLMTYQETDRFTGEVSKATETIVKRIDPFTGAESVAPPVISGTVILPIFSGEPNTGQHVLSDTLKYTETLPGDVTLAGNPVFKTLSLILSDPNDENALRANANKKLPPFQNEFREGDEFADIYVNSGGYELTRLQYRWRVPKSSKAVVKWDVQFTSYDDDHVEHEIHEWVSEGETISPTFLVDPRFSHGGANGYYDVILLAARPMVDGNRDGEMNFYVAEVHDADQTTGDKPYRFWLNDDDDTESKPAEAGGDPLESEIVPPQHQDFSLHQIVSKRNLEDFSRLWIDMSAARNALSSGLHIGVKWKNTTGAPAINIYPSEDSNGSTKYLTDEAAAARQIGSDTFNNAITDTRNKNTVDTNGTFVFKDDYWIGLTDDNPKKCFLFEGASEGKGELTIVFLDQDGNELAEAGSVWLDLKNIKSMYERVKVQPEMIDPPYNTHGPADDPPVITTTAVADPNGYSPDFTSTSWLESPQYLVFVHGWNQDYYRSTNYAETMFKRVWWKGYKGRFVSFRWPTYYAGSFDPSGFVTARYNDSEYVAWKSGQALAQYINGLSDSYVKSTAAHSMGNIVVGSALQQGIKVDHYTLLHAAVPAYCYDTNRSLEVLEFTTPDHDQNTDTRALGYLGQLSTVDALMTNFYDFQDLALNGWEYNNAHFRPQRFNGSLPPDLLGNGANGYYYNPSAAVGEKLGLTFLTSVGRFVRAPHEAMSYVDQSRSKTAGVQNVSGAIASGVDTALPPFAFGTDHGAEWNQTIQTTTSFYDQFLISIGVEP